MLWRYLLGGVAGLLLLAAGYSLATGQSSSPSVLPAVPGTAGATATPLPDAVPEASDKTREEKRFGRYDKDKNGQITREEYLASRRKAYARLDTNHDGTLSFDEWAVKATTKFAAADADKSGTMTAPEFATTAVVRKPKPKCACPPPAPAGEDDS